MRAELDSNYKHPPWKGEGQGEGIMRKKALNQCHDLFGRVS